MPALFKTRQSIIRPLILLIITNGLLVAPAPASVRFAAALVLLGGLPGWGWLQALAGSRPNLLEKGVLAAGLSLALAIFGALAAAYLPGPLTTAQLLVIFNAITVAGLVAMQAVKNRPGPRVSNRLKPPALAALLLVLLLAVLLRLPRLGYAEFHEDEAEALMLGVRLLQGEDYALFLHRKGPAQMLVPVAAWVLTGRITETMARLPFALSSILSVAAIFLMGQRWFGWQAGGMAALLWAVNGYSLAFGRMVQYQAIIFFLGPLAIYSLYLAWRFRRPGLQIVAALLLAACLLAHFDALLLLPAAAYLGWLAATRPAKGKAALTAGIAVVLFGLLLAAFYVPYLLDPEFKNTVAYLSRSRVKPGLLYNNLHLLQRLDAAYSSRFYLPLLAPGITGFGVGAGFRLLPTTRRKIAGGVVGLLLVSTILWPDIWQVGPASLALLPWLAALGLVWLAGPVKTRAVWLMFGSALTGYVFLVDDPRTHLYIIYPAAVLLAGAGWKRIWDLRFTIYDLRLTIGNGSFPSETERKWKLFTPLLFATLLLATLPYEAIIFLNNESTLARWRARWDGSAWETVYNHLPAARSYFGYPKREGWKTIGVLRAQGRFPGDFRSTNEDFIIPIWYNFGQARSCYTTPAQYFVRLVDNTPPLPDRPYVETARIQREGETRLRIFSAQEGNAAARPAVYTLEAFETAFDGLATPRRFTRQNQPARPVGTRFGPSIELVGYDLPTGTLSPGGTLYLNLYWQALEPPGDTYRAFVHLTGDNRLWAQQDDDPACRLPTTVWRAGQRGIGQFRLSIPPDIPPGRYPLVIGLYQAGTLERLKITAGAGQPGDDFLWLADIQITGPDGQQ